MNTKRMILLGLGLFLFVSLNTWATNNVTELYIAAAISLKDALTEIQANYQQKKPNIKIHLNLGSSGSLQNQIEQGAPADIFISAASKQMDALDEEKLLVTKTRKNLLGNQLVLIVPKDSKLGIGDFTDLISDKVGKIGIGAPEPVPAGQYALEVFKKTGIWEKIQGKLVLGTNVRAVLAYVETGNVDAGVVYRTDALTSDKVKIAAVAPRDTHKPITYPVAILTNARYPKEATKFITYLTGREAKSIFRKYGFVIE
jgi:molybdate transport system substrate-binding protein